MNKTPKILLLLIAVFIMFGLMAVNKPATASAAMSIKDCKQWHTVRSGEYLSQIAKTYGTDYRTIAEINGVVNPNLIYSGQQLCVSMVSGATPVIPQVTGSANVYATNVKEDTSVTLHGKNLVALSRYTVYLSSEKAHLATPIFVGVVTTDKDGAFKVTYNIPKKLIDVPRVKVTITNTKGNTASNWFYNATLDGNTGGVYTPAISIVVDSSKVNKWVKIKVTNLQAKMTYDVFIGKEGSKGVKGVQVGTLSVAKSGSVMASFDIPDEYKDKAKLDIRLENKPYGIVSYLTFANKNH
jgi:hypothetical protein